MPAQPYQVYVVQGRANRDFADCQAALAEVPARVTSLPFLGTEDEMIARTRDADALVTSSSPVTRGVMGALEGLKVVARTGVGYDVIDVRAATELGVVVVNIPDIWVREVANHALALLLAWNRKIITLDRQVHAGVWSAGVPGERTGALHGETVGIVGLGNIGSAFARRVAAFETKVIAHDPYVDDARFAALGVERVSLEALAENLRSLPDASARLIPDVRAAALTDPAFVAAVQQRTQDDLKRIADERAGAGRLNLGR